MQYTADFETTTNIADCRVWAFGVCEIGNPDMFVCGNTIDDFMKYIEQHTGDKFYFHNLKFDGEFIIHWLLTHNWKHNPDSGKLNKMEFSTLISDKGNFYQMKICFGCRGERRKIVEIIDSLKIIPFSVEVIAKTFGIEEQKLEINYNEYREAGHILTDKEKEYLRHDVVIMAKALDVLFKQGLKQMTQGGNALHDFKQIITKKEFERRFPQPDYDSDLRQSYKGGYTYLKEGYGDRDIGEGIVLDVNSLYPSVMYYSHLPYGEGKFFEGKYVDDEQYNLYIQMFTCRFKLKEGHLPTIQLKHSLAFVPTEYIKDSGEEDVTLCLTSPDLELFFTHYEVDESDIDWIAGWKFKSTNLLFRPYIDKWVQVKIDSETHGNKGMRTLAKLMLNALYGKFALNPNVRSKYPYLSDGVVKYELGPRETRDPIYLPVGTFVTAWARYKTITSAQKLYDRFVYADTDSLHLIGLEEPEGIEIHPTKLGAWKHESTFCRARFLRAKCYVEEDMNNKELKITCAGMPKVCHKDVTWGNFHPGSVFSGKLRNKHVEGGIVLVDTPFTIKL